MAAFFRRFGDNAVRLAPWVFHLIFQLIYFVEHAFVCTLYNYMIHNVSILSCFHPHLMFNLIFLVKTFTWIPTEKHFFFSLSLSYLYLLSSLFLWYSISVVFCSFVRNTSDQVSATFVYEEFISLETTWYRYKTRVISRLVSYVWTIIS